MGDSIVVYDRSLGRLSVLSRTGKYVRGFTVLPTAYSVLALGGTSAIVAGRFAGTSTDLVRRKLPLHLLQGESVVRSFGEVVSRVDPREPFQYDRLLLSSPQGFISVSRANHLIIEVWDRGGSLQRRFVYEPSWFPVQTSLAPTGPSAPPPPIVYDGWVDENQLLWLIVGKAGQRWREAFDSALSRGEGGQSIHRLIHPELLYQGVAVVVDLQRRELVVARPLPFLPRFALGGSVVADFAAIGTSVGAIRLHKLTLRQ